MKIYTKTGDKGETSFPAGKRVCKCCVEMRVVGALDELNASLGVVIPLLPRGGEGGLPESLKRIQSTLFKLGAEVAACQTKTQNSKLRTQNLVGAVDIVALEKQIDEWWTQLPELKNFILPGGGLAAAHLHLARAVCRRAERELVAFGKKTKLRPELYQYLNRLSDWLFTAARWVNFKAGEKEKKG